ncbi:MAG: hypothetical protein R3181_08280 [Rubricoccaceae bacterium]|nr:hypothetical protein [Rubricoccaceae bacterium]
MRTASLMNTSTLLWGLALGLVVALAGCDHATEFEGPRLIDRFGDFAVLDTLTASQETVDFAAGESVVFMAQFNKQVNWVVEVVGQESGAVKRIEGFSSTLTAENAEWEGRTTELPFFKEEPVEARLFVPEEASDTSRVRIEVLATREYEGIVVADFEPDSDVDIFVGNFEFEFEGAGISAEVPPAEGEAFYLLRGTDDVVNNFFVGLIDITPGGGGFFEVPTSVPEELYFNVFAYSFGTPNTIAVVQLIADANGSGEYEDGQDAVFPIIDRPVDWEGWQAISVPLSELLDGEITQAQAQEIVAVRVLLISDNNNQPMPPLPVDFGIDYITFTAGAPLQL